MTEERSHLRFEDTDDMMDHVHEKLEDAVYYYCLYTKLMMHGADERIIKALLIQIVEEQFDELNKKIIPYIEIKDNETIFYGLIQKDF